MGSENRTKNSQESLALSLDPSPARKQLKTSETNLRQLLDGFCQQSTLNARLQHFSRLVEWVRSANQSSSVSVRTKNLENLISLLEEDAPLQARVQRTFHALLGEAQAVSLIAEAGLHPRESLWSEAVRRMAERILPSAIDDSNLLKLVYRLHSDGRHIQGFLDERDKLFGHLVEVLTPADDPAAWNRQRLDLQQSLCLLGAHVAGVGLSPEVRERCHPYRVDESPFYRVQQLADELAHEDSRAKGSTLLNSFRAETARCRSELAYMHERMEDRGVSTALEFDMSTIERALRRMDLIASVLFAGGVDALSEVKRLLDDVMRARLEDLSLSAVVRENAGLLARKIVERTGKTGEHYIANSRSEYWGMWKAALGGGLLTVATAAIKMKIIVAGLPPFFDGVLVGTNYAISFLILQGLGLALATKQPSMTAATYAKIVRMTQGKERLEKLTEFISRITRTQLAAAIGNLLTVSLGAVLFARAWMYFFSKPYLPGSDSAHVYETLNPLASGTVLYAALTGVVLWISALAGGWVENFAIYNRLPEAIADHPWGLRMGVERMKRAASIFERNISGWSTSIVLGYLLGFIPFAGHIFGVPLDVRHVTLSTGTLALAATSLGKDWLYRGWFLHTLLGIAVIFVLNLGVSFGIASWVAFRAYDVPYADHIQLFKYVLKSFFRAPGRFLYPARAVSDPR